MCQQKKNGKSFLAISFLAFSFWEKMNGIYGAYLVCLRMFNCSDIVKTKYSR